eukprot:3938796-Rhodomonas_salina.2
MPLLYPDMLLRYSPMPPPYSPLLLFYPPMPLLAAFGHRMVPRVSYRPTRLLRLARYQRNQPATACAVLKRGSRAGDPGRVRVSGVRGRARAGGAPPPPPPPPPRPPLRPGLLPPPRSPLQAFSSFLSFVLACGWVVGERERYGAGERCSSRQPLSGVPSTVVGSGTNTAVWYGGTRGARGASTEPLGRD